MGLRVAILNGWGFSDVQWSPFSEGLVKMLGIALSDIQLMSWHDCSRGLDYQKAAVVFLREQLKGEADVLVIGWSLGAIAALDAMRQLDYKPTAMLILSGSAAFCREGTVDSIGRSLKDLVAMKKRLLTSRPRVMASFFQRQLSVAEREVGLDVAWLLESHCMSYESLSAGLDYLMTTDLRGDLSTIDVPILWLHGEQDIICPLAGAIDAVRHFKRAELMVVAGAGHAIHITQTQACLRAIEDFLIGLNASDGEGKVFGDAMSGRVT